MLGEALISAGVITRAQLVQAMEAQQVFGGKLGTNLVELGFISLNTLTDALAEKHRLPRVDAFANTTIPPDVLAALPRRLIEKHHVVPLELKGKRLTVLMGDPSNFPALDELQFATGFTLIARVVPELTLWTLLERHYGIKREVRYIALR